MKREKDPKSTLKVGKDRVTERSDLAPLPYYPNLKLALRSVTASIVMTYLETHLPAPDPPPGSRPSVSSLPVTLSIDKVARDLCISRRTLYVSLCILASRWKTEEARACAARANREFHVPQHSRHMAIKVYSLTGPWTYDRGTILQIRRNLALVATLLAQAGFVIDWKPPQILVGSYERASATLPTVHSEGLKDILLRASVLREDRRNDRYVRAWAAERRKLEARAKRKDARVHRPPGNAPTSLPEGQNGLSEGVIERFAGNAQFPGQCGLGDLPA
jgi:hypothetical protein